MSFYNNYYSFECSTILTSCLYQTPQIRKTFHPQHETIENKSFLKPFRYQATMRNPPIFSDEEAARQAALSRDQACDLVRSHLDRHAANNPGASSDYVTWIATLHPENADITIDQRFFVPGTLALIHNVWKSTCPSMMKYASTGCAS
jgi:hypothetical protein